MDITQTTIAKSDQQNFDDYMTGITRTVTITEVKGGSSEQPVEIHIAEYPGRPYKPSKSMRRVLVASWGAETSVYIGRKMTLYGDPNVKFGGAIVGGIKISHLSHIDKPLKIALTVTRGKREPFTVAPLLDRAPDKEKSFVANSADLPTKSADTNADKVTAEQMKTIGELMGKLGMSDPAIQLAYAGDCVEREIKSASELSAHEATRLITYLQKDVEQIEQTKLAAEAKADGDE